MIEDTGLPHAAVALAVAFLSAATAGAVCRAVESRRQYEGTERTIVTLENERIIVEVVPELGGRVIRYADKTSERSAFEWLDDCPYHYGCRWEGKPFTHALGERGPDRASVTVKGGGKIAVAHLRGVLGVSLASPLDLTVERTMSIGSDSTRMRVDVMITNTGGGVAPEFRYMVHSVFGQVPPMPGGRAYWFLPAPGGVEFFDSERGSSEMWSTAGGASVDHPFSRFVPGRKADKPRYEALGWGALLTSAGATYIYYDPAEYDFMQYWFGGDSAWHFTFEPHTKPVDLKPGETVSCTFTFAYDANDVPFTTGTLAIRRPEVPGEVTPGSAFAISASVTTVRDEPEHARVKIEVKGPDGGTFLSRDVEGEAQPFKFAELSTKCDVPADAALGRYSWRALREGGRELASGTFEVVTAEDLAKRKMERATADLRAGYEKRISELDGRIERSKQHADAWRAGANLALSLAKPEVWPEGIEPPAEAVSFRIRPRAVPVLGRWKENEPARVEAFATAPPLSWPAEAERMLEHLGADRALVRAVAVAPGGEEIAALVVERERNRVQILRLNERGVSGRFGRFSDRPTETDDRLGPGARSLDVDADGNIWVGTNAWGEISIYVAGPTGQPSEKTAMGPKGAVKKFSRDGRLLGSAGLLDAPMDLVPAAADGVPVVLATYRNVSRYHGAQVREGAVVLRVADVRRLGELKVPGGSLAIDAEGRVWAADVAGHVTRHTSRGGKLLDFDGSPAPAVPDAALSEGAAVPAVLRADGEGGVWILQVHSRKLARVGGDDVLVPGEPGAVLGFVATPEGPVVVGEKGVWRP
jgi:hypothetical protein